MHRHSGRKIQGKRELSELQVRTVCELHRAPVFLLSFESHEKVSLVAHPNQSPTGKGTWESVDQPSQLATSCIHCTSVHAGLGRYCQDIVISLTLPCRSSLTAEPRLSLVVTLSLLQAAQHALSLGLTSNPACAGCSRPSWSLCSDSSLTQELQAPP